MRSSSVFVAVFAAVALWQSCHAAALYEAEDAEHWDNGARDADADAALAVCPFHPACWQAVRPATMAALLRRNTRAYSYGGHVDDRFSKKSKFGNGIRLTK